MGETIIEKIIRHNTGKAVKPGDIVTVNVDRCMIHDIFIPFVADKFEEMGFTKLHDPDKVVLIYDHLVPASQQDDTRHFHKGDEFVDPQHVTEHEVIGALALSHSVQEMAGSAGYISDKTMRIALQFQDETERLNRDASFEIAQELFNVRRKMKKLEFYVSQLPPKQAEVIRKHYFEEYSWPALQKELHVSSRTLINRRDEGLNELATMYQYMEQVTQSSKKTPEQNG